MFFEAAGQTKPANFFPLEIIELDLSQEKEKDLKRKNFLSEKEKRTTTFLLY